MIKKTYHLRSLVWLTTLLFSLCFSTDPNTITGVVSDPDSTFDYPIDIAITPDGSTAYVVNQSGDSVSIVNISSNSVTGTVDDTLNTLEGPTAIAITPDGTTAYITNYSPDGNSVSILDVATNAITGIVSDGDFNQPVDVAITPDGTTAYVTNEGNNTVSIIDVGTNMVTGTVSDPDTLLSTPTAIAIKPDGSQAFIVNQNSTVAILEISTNTIVGLISNLGAPATPYDVIVTPDSATAFISNASENQIFVVQEDTAITATGATDPRNLAITPSGTVFYAIQANNTVQIYSASNYSSLGLVSDPLSTFYLPFAMAITPNGLTGYITNLYGNSVSILFIANAINPPSSFQGCSTSDTFLLQSDLINKLSWTAPTSGTTPTSYSIYYDSELTDLVATIPASAPLLYLDHNRTANILYTYYIVSNDADDNSSSAICARITSACT